MMSDGRRRQSVSDGNLLVDGSSPEGTRKKLRRQSSLPGTASFVGFGSMLWDKEDRQERPGLSREWVIEQELAANKVRAVSTEACINWWGGCHREGTKCRSHD